MAETQSAAQAPILPMIRSQVRERLTDSPAFRSLPADKRKAVAHDTVKALQYILGGEDGKTIPSSVTLAGEGKRFTPRKRGRRRRGSNLGQAARRGGRALSELVEDIDFPAFVGGLIDGVFNSIVTTSIKQMEAYADLVRNVSKSVDQYMKDNITEDNARDHLVEKYPDHLELVAGEDGARVKPKEGADDQTLPDFFADLGLTSSITSLDDENVESELVPAARRRIAMDRQQLLATMVMMGINRLVVTNGTIEASCLFELDTTDTITRSRSGTRDINRDIESSSERRREGEFGSTRDRTNKFGYKKDGLDLLNEDKRSSDYKSSWYDGRSDKKTASFKMHTSRNDSSEQSIQTHAKLGGRVKVNFKSDYFPMERMVDVLQINQIRDKSMAAGGAQAQQQQPAAPLAPIPPPPALPPIASPGLPPGTGRPG